MIPVLLSGGSGTRLWPVSRTKYPKQFCELFDESLLIKTMKRLSPNEKPWIVTSLALRDFTEKKMKSAGYKDIQYIYEPEGKNTAPAIALLCKVLEMQGSINGNKNPVVAVFPADHLIEKEDVFQSALELAELCAQQQKIVTLGLKPTHPATGYGYIQTQKEPFNFKNKMSSYSVLKFHEKPNLSTANAFLKDGSYYWNAGIFIFPLQVMIAQLQKYQPQIWSTLQNLKTDMSNLKEIYLQMPSISIDYAIMEKLNSEELVCVPCQPGWSDVGSWDAVAEVYEKNGQAHKESIEVNSHHNFVMPRPQKKYVFVGVHDLVVVDTADALLVAQRGQTEDVKQAVDRLKTSGSKVVHEHVFEERPWGRFEILRDQDLFKSKVIHVDPGQQISYQSHAKREEHWVIVKGQGEVVLNDEIVPIRGGSYIHIPKGAKHRIRNTGSEVIEFIEVQLGSYFGEDDIVRYQDDYRRT